MNTVLLVVIVGIAGVIVTCLAYFTKKCCHSQTEDIDLQEVVVGDAKVTTHHNKEITEDEVDKPKPLRKVLGEKDNGNIEHNQTVHGSLERRKRESFRKKEAEKNKENRVVLLNSTAIKKHIYPNCNSDRDAERFSQQRNKLSNTLINTVLRVEPHQFHQHRNGRFICSNNKVQFWQCERSVYTAQFRVHTLILTVTFCISNHFRLWTRDTSMPSLTSTRIATLTTANQSRPA